jgi:hypothetical protein
MPSPRAPPTVAEIFRKVRLDVGTGIPVKAEMNTPTVSHGWSRDGREFDEFVSDKV